jgi:hypothetical protein
MLNFREQIRVRSLRSQRTAFGALTLGNAAFALGFAVAALTPGYGTPGVVAVAAFNLAGAALGAARWHRTHRALRSLEAFR